MRLGIPTGVDTPLGKRLAWLIAVRLIVLTIFLAITELYYFKELAFGGFSSKVAIGTVAVAYGLAAAYALLLRRGRGLRAMAHAQLATDQITWTAIAFISGGVTSGATSLYGLTCLSGAILLYTPGALSAGAAGIVSYAALCTALATGWLPIPLDQTPAAYVTIVEEMVYPALSTVMTTAVVTLLAAYLAERLRAFGGSLKDATERAEQAERLAAMGRLAAALAHEIRNPLGAIRGSIELLRTGDKVSAEDGKLCEIVEREVQRLDDLVGDMLHLARPRAPDISGCDLAVVAQNVVQLAQSSVQGTDVKVCYEGPDELEVVADAGQMRQVLWNLVRNAIQTSSGSTEVLVRLSRSEGAACLDVQDSGDGIGPEEQRQIFEAFFTTRSHGVGIGLAVVKQITERHGFEMSVDSTPGKGTVFTMRVPSKLVVAALCLAVFAATASCNPSRSWGDPESPSGFESTSDDDWQDGSAAAPADPTAPPPGARATADAGATGSAASPHAPAVQLGVPPDASSDPAQAAGSRGKFRNTYYDFPSEADTASTAATETVYSPDCKPIRTVNKEFHDALCVQGSGRLATGQTVSFAKRDCPCAAECPRTAQRICFEALDPQQFPHGRGAMGTAITPLRSVAVDPAQIPLGTVLYIPEYHGLRDLAGKPHDGCFIAEDRGLRVRGAHVDIFTGAPRATRAWNKAVPSNQGVHVIVGATRCAKLRRPTG